VKLQAGSRRYEPATEVAATGEKDRRGLCPAPTAALAIDHVEQVAVLFKPLRLELMQLLAEPRTCTQLGAALGLTPQNVYYHVKLLERAGLVDRVESRQVRGAMEGVYRATARSYWLSPELTSRLGGGRAARRSVSLNQLAELARQVENDAAELAAEADAAALCINAAVELEDPRQRTQFMRDLRQAVQELAERYGARAGTGRGEEFRLLVACYRRPGQRSEEPDQKDGS